MRDFDWLLTFLAIGLVCFGTYQIRNAQPTEPFWIKQLIGLAIALVAMLAVAFTDYRKVINIAPAFYFYGLFLLVIVLVPGIGLKINGQRSWIRVPGIGQFQPSEFVKVTTAMKLARYFGKHRAQALTWKEIGIGIGILALPIILILGEHDVGSVLTYVPLLAIVLFVLRTMEIVGLVDEEHAPHGALEHFPGLGCSVTDVLPDEIVTGDRDEMAFAHITQAMEDAGHA